MKCHQCQFADTKVIESRDVADGESTRRRRECAKCHSRFTTYERLERPQLIVIKQDGSRELFSRAKLIAGLHRACEKTAVTNLQLEALVARVESELYGRGEPEVGSREIGELVMANLADLSDVAYVRFASVYRRFSDITGFEAELHQIRSRHAKKHKQRSALK
ncbi:MAG TPA: transcriptional regulator NrdR [Patescibacteria group bacterium]|nr:transcriptional regulator NrdR [Patescibacteria group bacterium]